MWVPPSGSSSWRVLVAGGLGGIGVGGRLVGMSGVVSGCAGGAGARGCGGACLVGVAGDVGTAVGSGYGGDRTDGGGAQLRGCRQITRVRRMPTISCGRIFLQLLRILRSSTL